MQRYSSEDYAPPSSKNLKRRALIDKVLKLTCAVVGGRIVESGGEKGLVGVKADFSGRFVKLYFEKVTRLKMNNEYLPGGRINQPKICALMLKTLKEFSWEGIFIIEENSVPKNTMEELHCEMEFSW